MYSLSLLCRSPRNFLYLCTVFCIATLGLHLCLASRSTQSKCVLQLGKPGTESWNNLAMPLIPHTTYVRIQKQLCVHSVPGDIGIHVRTLILFVQGNWRFSFMHPLVMSAHLWTVNENGFESQGKSMQPARLTMLLNMEPWRLTGPSLSAKGIICCLMSFPASKSCLAVVMMLWGGDKGCRKFLWEGRCDEEANKMSC